MQGCTSCLKPINLSGDLGYNCPQFFNFRNAEAKIGIKNIAFLFCKSNTHKLYGLYNILLDTLCLKLGMAYQKILVNFSFWRF